MIITEWLQNTWIAMGVIFGAGIAFAKALNWWLEAAEKALRLEEKKKLGHWLNEKISSNKIFDLDKWPEKFLTVFNAAFGRYILSYRFILNSFCASLLTFTVLGITSHAVYHRGISIDAILDTARNPYFIIGGTYLLISNFIIDYICIIKTRFMLNIAAKAKSIKAHALLMTVDIIFAITIYFIIFTVWATIWFRFVENSPSTNLHSAFQISIFMLRQAISFDFGFSGYALSMGTFLYASLFLNAWVTVFVIGITLASAVGRLRNTLRWSASKLDIEQEPFKALQLYSNTLIFSVFVTVGVLFKMMTRSA